MNIRSSSFLAPRPEHSNDQGKTPCNGCESRETSMACKEGNIGMGGCVIARHGQVIEAATLVEACINQKPLSNIDSQNGLIPPSGYRFP